MHDMSNTRKEIAARLGFAAKAKMAVRQSGDDDDETIGMSSTKAEIISFYDSHPDLTLAQLSRMTGRDVQELKRMLMSKNARPGAKAEFAIDARDELMMRTWIKNNYPKADNAAFNKMLAKMTKEYAKDPKGYTYGGGFRAVAKAAGFSRDSAKATMTRDQTEEQKAGLKIMSAADPAVGAKIATLIKEGKPQDQAVAIALDMKRRGEL